MINLDNLQEKSRTPIGLNHLVIRVRDLELSHTFWTECLGFVHVGTMSRPDADGSPTDPTRFYSGERDGLVSHHDIALVQDKRFADSDLGRSPLDHIAIAYADEEEWRAQIKFLRNRSVDLYRPVKRGTTYSIHLKDPNGYTIELVCELPRASWDRDINRALNEPPLTLLA